MYYEKGPAYFGWPLILSQDSNLGPRCSSGLTAHSTTKNSCLHYLVIQNDNKLHHIKTKKSYIILLSET